MEYRPAAKAPNSWQRQQAREEVLWPQDAVIVSTYAYPLHSPEEKILLAGAFGKP